MNLIKQVVLESSISLRGREGLRSSGRPYVPAESLAMLHAGFDISHRAHPANFFLLNAHLTRTPYGMIKVFYLKVELYVCLH